MPDVVIHILTTFYRTVFLLKSMFLHLFRVRPLICYSNNRGSANMSLLRQVYQNITKEAHIHTC